MAKAWAAPLSDPEAREYAEEAAELILRKGFELPKLKEEKIKPIGRRITYANYRPPLSFDLDNGTITINTHPYIRKNGGWRKTSKAEVASGWSSQENIILHELSHMVDYWCKAKFPKGVKDQISDRFDRLDTNDVKDKLSLYGSTSAVEFRAELISGVLSGKVYPKEFLDAAYIDTYLSHHGMADIYDMGTGKVPNTSMTEKKYGDMVEVLFDQKGSALSIRIMETGKVQEFIESHAQVLDNGFKYTPMSDAMRRSLQKSDYIFSGIKTFHELNEAFPSLLDENGKRKPFEEFLKDVRKIDQTYNANYLRSEYNFVQASAGMAAKWEQFEQDGDRYNLQYRTAGDDKVRPEHAKLNGVTLPPSDPFWQKYYPPNGWNCRCTVVQVRKSKYPVTPHEEAMERGAEATERDKKGIFRFNAGIERKTVPDYNPYTIKRCRDCDIAKGKLELAFVPENELCEACKMIHSMRNKKDENTVSRSKIRDAQKRLVQRYKELLQEVRVGKFISKRLNVITGDGVNVVINKKFYQETISKYQDDSMYPIKLEYAHKAHDMITRAILTNPSEPSTDYPDATFRVYEYIDDCYRIEMKVRCNRDGNYLHILRVYKK